ncbi:RNA-binding protein 7 isoform X1 [Carica papaya]|uniref:RNA-binding protein 7 isoform X1 n=1 Tax=Carica papaya TaxID=3649 RepID=UPI000B8CB460|nr:RNA-binding protein 7 isoform X1 [Carica papaya]
MSDNSGCTVYVGNLDERVSDRVLYDILIQAGRLVDLYIPRDKETDKPKGYAFAEYETEEIADYAVRLFSGLVTLYKRTLKFAISGQDKPAQSASMTTTPGSNIPHKSRRYTVSNMDSPQHSVKVSPSCKVSAYASNYSQEPAPPGVKHHINGYGSHFNGINYEYSRRVFGSTLDSISHFRSRRFDTTHPISYRY